MEARRAGEPRSGCPINAAVEVIGDRWSLLVLRDIMFGNRRHFRVLQACSEEGIASNILADRLHRLVSAGLLTRADAGRGRRVTYSLTEAAIELVPVMAALGEWGLRNRATTPTLRVRAELLADGGPPLWEDLMAELRTEHLGAPPPPGGPTATERLASAYAEAVARETGFTAEVDPAVHRAYPDYVAVVLVASGLANGPTDSASDAQLTDAEDALRASGLARATDHPHIAAWRAAFSAFGAKPSRYPSSAEALIGRVLKGQPLPRINALVDIYNSVSVRHVVPVGGEDADRLEGPLRLTVAAGGEPFDPRGDGSDTEPAAAGEIVWRDDRGVTCRRWNWRQGRRTQLTGDTARAFFVFDRLDGLDLEALHRAVDDLARGLTERWPDCRLQRIQRPGSD